MKRRSKLRLAVDEAVTEFYGKLVPLLRDATAAERKSLLREIQELSTTNCWFFTYDMRHVLLKYIDQSERESLRRGAEAASR